MIHAPIEQFAGFVLDAYLRGWYIVMTFDPSEPSITDATRGDYAAIMPQAQQALNYALHLRSHGMRATVFHLPAYLQHFDGI